MAIKPTRATNSLSAWSKVIKDMGAEQRREDERRLILLREQTEKLDPRRMDDEKLVALFLQTHGRTMSIYMPLEREQYEIAFGKLRDELMRRLKQGKKRQ